MTASPDDGVIKFQLQHTHAPLPATVPAHVLSQLISWRRVLFSLGLIGQDAQRYGGAAYGNLSARLPDGSMLISGTQTGGLPQLLPHHFCVVTSSQPHLNSVTTVGPIAPSSEAMTHVAIYTALPDVEWVFHAHSPDVWNAAHVLDLPSTAASVPYGTPAMVTAVETLLAAAHTRETRLFAMLGHEDGVVSFGTTARQAGDAMVNALAQAWSR